MAEENIIGTTLPHLSFGDPECCGSLNAVIRGDHADIVCNECSRGTHRPRGGSERTFDAMELTLETASEICPHCGKVNLFLGFSRMEA
jgi:hypothetical protein